MSSAGIWRVRGQEVHAGKGAPPSRWATGNRGGEARQVPRAGVHVPQMCRNCGEDLKNAEVVTA